MADFPIVGIGSSAGGLDALQKLFGAMPPESGFAFVVVAHLDPTHESQLAALIARCTAIPVNEVEKPVTVEPDHVYVIAPNQHLTFEGDVLRPSRPSEVRGERYPLDLFFRSLAEHQGNCAIGIVLSGTGTSGAQGLHAVKAEGGIAVAQDPGTAGFSDMPRHAIATGVVDLVLPPDQMPEALLRLVRHPYMRQQAEFEQLPEVDGQLESLLSLLRAETKQDFRCYKRPTLLRRTHRRMSLRQIEDMAVYIERLRNEPDELAALAKDLTITVSGFFRDPQAWESLDKKVIAQLVAERPDGASIRIWVPGCSTGEEAYSIAMLIAESAAAVQKSFGLKIFASDVSEHLLPVARAGLYPASIAEDVRPARLERFFDREDDSYRVKRELREMITFAPQNLLQDPPFSQLDLITCRNLLIYLEPGFQKKVVALFHFALREGGHLFLGPAETVSGHDDLFHPISRRWRIYARVGQTRHDIVDFPLIGPSHVSSEHQTPAPPAEPRLRAREHFQRDLLERYAPASVLIDDRFSVHAFQGSTGEFLQHPSGDPTTNLLALAREGLQAPLRAAVQRAIGEKQEVVADGRLRRGGALRPIRIAVRPLRPARIDEGMLTVSFFEREMVAEAPGPVEERRPESELEAELNATREELRFTLEQMETSNAELQASNEEIRSINEEFQASNEELETSKEELQSLNEELRTVNNQLQVKVKELERRTNDLNNLLNSTEIATLFLDRELGVRWFTPAMQGLLELRASDVGRPVSHFDRRFTGNDFLEDVRDVLQRLVPRTSEVVGDDDRTYIRRILPYRTSDDRIDGVVVTFTDITERKLWEQEIQGAREFAESIVDTVREPLLVLTPDLKVRSANESFYRDLQVSDETQDRPLYELGNGQWNIPELRRLLEEVLPHDKQFSDFEVEREFEGIGRRTLLLNGRRLDHVQLILLAIEDITERKRAEAALRASEERLRRVLETDAVGVIFFDRAGTVVDCNEVFLRVTGHSRSEVDARELTWRKMTPPEWIAESEEQMRKMEATGRIGPYEKEYLLKDGSRCWMLFAGADLGDGTIVEYCIDISARKRAEEERELLARELSHRVKNTLAVVQALAMQTGGRITSVEAFREAFVGRLQAMARAHSLLLDAHWQSADLKSLVEQTIAAYQVDDPQVVAVEGDPVVITPKQGLGLSLVLHELGTNAAKYGALSSSEGRLRVSWQVEHGSAPRLRLTWQERHGPKVEPPTEEGFGLQLIERACTYELEGEVELDYAPEGLTCVVVFPLA